MFMCELTHTGKILPETAGKTALPLAGPEGEG